MKEVVSQVFDNIVAMFLKQLVVILNNSLVSKCMTSALPLVYNTENTE